MQTSLLTIEGDNGLECQQLQRLLTVGEITVEFISDLDVGREHWQNCPECQDAIPDAIARLDSIEWQLIRYSSFVIENIYHQYRADLALANHRETPVVNDEACKVLDRLAKAGTAVKDELDHHSALRDMGDRFRPIDPTCEYFSKTCAKMMAMLPQKVQAFVCEAAAADDMSRVFENGFPSDHATSIRKIIKCAVPEFVKTLLAEDTLQSSSATSAETQNSLGLYERIGQKLDDYCDRSEKDLDDAVDSLKACQMEMMWVLTRGIGRSAQHQHEDSPKEDSPKKETGIPPASSTAGPNPEPKQLTSADLGEIRRMLLRVLDFLGGPAPHNPEIRESPGSRVNRFRDAKKIPRMVAQLMKVVLEFRNAAEYDQYKLSAEESEAVGAAWRSIVEWAKQQGWEPQKEDELN